MKTKQIIKTSSAPSPIGPYNQATMAGGFLFISGQIALDPETGELHIGDISSETTLVMKHLQVILAAAGMTFENVVKTSIFLKDMGQFAQVNEVYARYFEASTAPARETVEVACLPKNVHVEISMVAYKG